MEAKKLSEPLASGIEQALNYCNRQGINYMVVTDGDLWEMYEVFRQARIEDRRLLKFSISGQPSHQSALKALLLWQPNISYDQGITPSPQSGLFGVSAKETITEAGSPLSQTPSDRGSRGAWVSIASLHPESNGKPPTAIRLAHGEPKPIKYWRDILVTVANWLAQRGILTAGKCPIGHGHARHLVHTQPKHPNGSDFSSVETLSNGLFLETKDSGPQLVRNTQFLFAKLNVSLNDVELTLD